MIPFDLDAYLARIGHTGARTPTLETLRAIQALHPATIPFENLNPLLRMPVKLDIESLQQKLIHSGRGGYCYEHNAVFKHALEALGFKVTGLGARVLWNRPIEAITARTHMLLLLDLAGDRFIADVGFGGQTLTAPLRLEVDTIQETPHEPCRLIRYEDDFVLQSQIRGEWRALYKFDLQPHYPPDYEITNWYLSNNPESHFVTGLRVARAVPGRRYGLLNNELSIHEASASQSRTLSSAQEMRDTLVEMFGIRLPDHPELTATLARLIP
jgi:N-hydroxyarylamine O-acetyltransferase